MTPPELAQEIALWRFAFRRGDPLQMEASRIKIQALASDNHVTASDIDDAMWADKADEVLLSPAPKAALREAISKGWNFRVYGVPGAVVNGNIVIVYDVALVSPSGDLLEVRAGERDAAFRAALDKAGIDY